MAVLQSGGGFLDTLRQDDAVTARLDDDKLTRLFDMAYHTKHVDTVFKRVFDPD